MPVPTFQEIMLPFLKILSNQETWTIKDLVKPLGKELKLTKEDLNDKIDPSDRQTRFFNRTSWAGTYLKKAYLLEQPERGKWKITQRGLDLLETKPKEINIKLLKKYDDFWDTNTRSKKVKSVEDEEQTPDENLKNSYQKIKNELSGELLEKILNSSPIFFERLVVDLLLKMGYGGSLKDAGKATKISQDGGIDGIIKEDKLGLDMIYIQAKRYARDNQVGRPDIQKFVGALAGQKARKGVFITTSSFSKQANDYAESLEQKVVLIDGESLVDYMIDLGLGVQTKETYEVKKLDLDYFDE